MSIKDLPTNFIEQNLRFNPGVHEFAWVEGGKPATRQLLLDELLRRGETQFIHEEIRRSAKRRVAPTPNLTTAVITTSPIPVHPSTETIDAAIESLQFHLPNVRILILADGVRNEQTHLTDNYRQYLMNVADKYPTAQLRTFSEFTHQGGMLRAALAEGLITTQLILWNEHDFVFTRDFIDWGVIGQALVKGEAAAIQFFCDESLDSVNGMLVSSLGLWLYRTQKYTGCPHIGTYDFFAALVGQFKEGKIHLDCPTTDLFLQQYREKYPMGVYRPEGKMQRFYSLDGRNRGLPMGVTNEKFEMTL